MNQVQPPSHTRMATDTNATHRTSRETQKHMGTSKDARETQEARRHTGKRKHTGQDTRYGHGRVGLGGRGFGLAALLARFVLRLELGLPKLLQVDRQGLNKALKPQATQRPQQVVARDCLSALLLASVGS